jgi:arylsulfatase A-like enzyme
VVIQVDGLPEGLLEEVLSQKDPHSGKSRLPWIDEVFVRQGTRLANFYVRGISLSAPSWAMLTTGEHQRIHGNAEFDRFTLRPYDYLNFFPFYLGSARGRQADMPGVEVLDAAGVPLLIDRFTWEQTYQSFQLYQRWVRWRTLKEGLENRFRSRSPRELFDEWQTGFGLSSAITEQTERDIMTRLQGDTVLYLDYFTGDFDHTAHGTNDQALQIAAIRQVDALIGRLWTAIQKSPMAADTVLAMVSDHGMNSVPDSYSQGYSLVDWFTSLAGGAQHVMTDRYPLDMYKVRGLNPMVSEVITPSRESTYLKGEADQYPTVVLDLDGNERAAVQLRSNVLNMLHMLLKAMARKETPERVRRAAVETFFDILDEHRPQWERDMADLREELGALDRAIASERTVLGPDAKRKWTQDDVDEGLPQPLRRRFFRLQSWEIDQHGYGEYVRVVSNLLGLRRENFDPRRVRIEDVIPKRSLGEANTVYDLQNYVVGPSREGLQWGGDKGLLVDESFRRLNYVAALKAIRVRINVQKEVGSYPIDFIAARVSRDSLPSWLLDADAPGEDAIWLYGGESQQAVLLARTRADGALELRYLPITPLRSRSDGMVMFSEAPWTAELPLHLWEDPQLDTGTADRAAWLKAWHTDREWLEAVHRTRYSNGIVGLHEQFVRAEPRPWQPATNLGPADQRLLLRLEARSRRLVEPDLLVLASDHWNFNIRNFNPGGNHGSFFRISTHSVLMFAGGADTGIPRGRVVEQPYDSLSFAPTLLRLAGRDDEARFGKLPGPLIREVLQ